MFLTKLFSGWWKQPAPPKRDWSLPAHPAWMMLAQNAIDNAKRHMLRLEAKYGEQAASRLEHQLIRERLEKLLASLRLYQEELVTLNAERYILTVFENLCEANSEVQRRLEELGLLKAAVEGLLHRANRS